jgi:hypothetical protein
MDQAEHGLGCEVFTQPGNGKVVEKSHPGVLLFAVRPRRPMPGCSLAHVGQRSVRGRAAVTANRDRQAGLQAGGARREARASSFTRGSGIARRLLDEGKCWK